MLSGDILCPVGTRVCILQRDLPSSHNYVRSNLGLYNKWLFVVLMMPGVKLAPDIKHFNSPKLLKIPSIYQSFKISNIDLEYFSGNIS